MRSILSSVLLAIAITACGGGGGGIKIVDSNNTGPDSGNPPPPPGCDYGELRDSSNDTLTPNSSGTPEQTFLTYTTGNMVLCGSIDMSHYDATNQTIDVDTFDISVGTAMTEVRVDLTGTGAEALDDVEILVFDSMGNEYGDGVFLTNHGVADVYFDVAGTFEFVMFAGSATAPTSTTAIPYKIKISPYDIESMCAVVTPTHYTEGTTVNDKGTTDNDTFAISYDGGPDMDGFFQLTTKTTDDPDPSGLTLAAGTNTAIAGSLVGTTAIDADDYLDRDTYSFTTGAAVNEVTVRVDWNDTTADLDMYMTPEIMAGTTDIPIVTSSAYTGGDGPEINITAVQASTKYWVWVGAYEGSSSPEPYTISICPATFTP